MNNLYDENSDTIAAIATAAGTGGIGIVRISGPEAPALLERVFIRNQPGAWQSHRLYLGQVRDPQSAALLDTALAVLMQAPHSYTREHVAELHCHGGPAVLRQVLAATVAAGARPAERGEFTLRAFLNGALSLEQAEAVADLISAKTTASARQAARQLGGGLMQRLAPLEQALLDMLAEITVAVDFPDDQDAPEAASLIARLEDLRAQIALLNATAQAGRVFREGISCVLAGASNVGKSSLLNRLLQAERAIVSATAGTTRDIIEETLDLDGLPLVLRDTAGLREAVSDEAEAIGMERSRAALELAQIVLIVLDASQGLDAKAQELAQIQAPGRLLLFVLNKADLVTAEQLAELKALLTPYAAAEDMLVISAKTGQGLPQLIQRLREKALGSDYELGREPLLNNIRHQRALLDCDAALADAQATLTAGLPLDLAGIDLENAWQALGSISGKTASDEVITNIFANFCVGK